MDSNKQQLQALAIAAISLAKEELSEDDFKLLDIPTLQQYILLISECVPLAYLTDQTLLRHAIHALISGNSAEETVMKIFMLYIFRLTSEGSNHPLERGIIKQQIIGILPIFENAVNKGLIKPVNYDKNADALAHIADSTGDVPEILEALSIEYTRLNKSINK